jgi:hypothetical protein
MPRITGASAFAYDDDTCPGIVPRAWMMIPNAFGLP